MRRPASLRVVTTAMLAAFGFVLGEIAWDELVGGLTVPDAFMIPFFGLPAFFASMASLARYLDPLLIATSDGQPRWRVSRLSSLVFVIPGGAAYVAWSILRTSRGALRGASRVTWSGWTASCTGMQVSMITELSGTSPTITYDGLYAAFGVLNALAVVTLVWTPSRTLLTGASQPDTGRGPATAQ